MRYVAVEPDRAVYWIGEDERMWWTVLNPDGSFDPELGDQVELDLEEDREKGEAELRRAARILNAPPESYLWPFAEQTAV